MDLEQVNEWLWRLSLPAVAAYAVRQGDGFNLVDAGLPGSAEEILDALAEIGGAPAVPPVHEIFLTHGHRDHGGSAARLVELTGARVLGPAADAPQIEVGRSPTPPVLADWEVPLFERLGETALEPPPPVRLDRQLEGGETLAWQRPALVLSVPGHTPGSLALHFPDARLLIAGDAIASAHGEPILGVFNSDPARASESFRRLAALDVEVACFGHGEPLLENAGAQLARRADTIGKQC